MDRFDDIWRNKFQQEDFSLENWNTPSEQTWSSVISEVRRLKRRRKLIPFALFFIAMGFFLIVIFFTLNSGMFSPDTNHSFSEMALAPNKNNPDNIGHDKTFVPAVLTTDQSYPATKSNAEKSADGDLTVNSASRNLVRSSVTFESGSSGESGINKAANPLLSPSAIYTDGYPNKTSQTIPLEKSEKLDDEYFFQGNYNLVSVDTDLSESRPDLSPLKSSLFFIDPIQINKFAENPIDLKSLDLKLSSPDRLESFDQNNPWSVGLYASPLIWGQTLSKSYTDVLEPFDFRYSKNNFGIQFGLEISNRLNDRFQIYFLPGYSIIWGSSGHNSTIQYKISDETEHSHSNFYAIDMATPFGFAGAGFHLIRKGDISTPEMELIPVFHSEHVLQSLSLPAGIRYHPFTGKSSIQPYISSGVIFDKIIKLENSLKEINPGNDLFTYETVSGRADITSGLIKVNWGVSIGAGSEIDLNDRYSLNINYMFSHGIGKIHENQQINGRTNRHQVYFSINKKLTKNKTNF